MSNHCEICFSSRQKALSPVMLEEETGIQETQDREMTPIAVGNIDFLAEIAALCGTSFH